MKKKITCLIAVVAFLNASMANAFKIDTHVWVGQQVINDLEDDGMLTIKLKGRSVTLPVPANVRAAILGNKKAFLTGNIGPDAVPDIVAGQMTTHPGLKTGWRTHDWMEHLLRKSNGNAEATAFAYGYLGHAAADVFAHTYVNQYAGDQFWLTDGETLVEQRHFILESFIGSHTPPLRDVQGNFLGNPRNVVGMSSSLADFVRNNLVYDPDVVRQYRKSDSLSPHLAAYADFRKAIDQLAEDPRWHDLDAFAIQVTAYFFDINLSEEEAGQIADAVQPVLEFLNGDMVDEAQNASNYLYDRMSRFDDRLFGTAAGAVQRMQDAEARWINKWQEKRRKLAELLTPPNCPRIPVCRPDPKWYNPGNIRCDMVEEPVCALTRQTIIQTNYAILQSLEFIENELLDLKQDLINATNDVYAEARKAQDAIRVIQNGIIDLAQIPGQGILPFQPMLRAWRGDVDVAMREYVKATSQAMINTMDRAAPALKPIQDWFSCYHLQILGVSSTVSSCEFRDAAKQAMESAKRIIDTIAWAQSIGARIGIPSPTELQNFIDFYKDDIINALKAEITDQLVSLLPPEVQELIALFDAAPTDALLNTYFVKRETGGVLKRLVYIEDMAARVRAEMKMNGEYFDPDKYAVAHNAVVLAKLALLDRTGLQALADAAGVPNNVSGSPLFGNTDNAVASAFDVIDGNHQWMANGTRPPRPNSTSPYDPNIPDSADLVPNLVTDYASPTPFVPWADPVARTKLFRAMFIGPLSPGIDAPQVIGKSRLLDFKYPYQPCGAQPFPNDNKDRTCIAVILGPILNQILQ